MKITYTEEAIADIVDAITYLHERNPTAAANLDAEIARCVKHLAAGEFEGPVSRLRSGAVVRSWAVRPFRIYYQCHPDELVIVRVYHQARRPITYPLGSRRLATSSSGLKLKHRFGVRQASAAAAAGISSRGYTPGPYSNREDLLYAFDRFIVALHGR